MMDKTRYHSKLKARDLKLIRIYLDEKRKQQWIANQLGVAQCTIAYHKRKMEEGTLIVNV
jgi:hypothetical protein